MGSEACRSFVEACRSFVGLVGYCQVSLGFCEHIVMAAAMGVALTVMQGEQEGVSKRQL
jgi:hypothetical protein